MITEPSNDERKNYPALTGFRALAAMAVFQSHYTTWPFTLNNSGLIFARQGYVGVGFFFVLSGFLLQHRYGERADLTKTFYKPYLRNRLARIYPLFFFITAWVLLLRRDNNPFTWFVNLTLTKSYFDIWKFSGVGPAWSLTVEETFYLLFPVLAYLMRRRISPFLMLGAVYLLGWLCFRLGAIIRFETLFESHLSMKFYTFFGRAFEFFVGMECAKLARSAAKNEHPTHYTGCGALVTLASWFALSAIALSFPTEMAPVAFFVDAGMVLHNLVMPIGVGMLLIGLAREKTTASRLLATPLAQLLGRASYAFYLLQPSSLLEELNIHARPEILCLYTWTIAIVVFLLVEDPINRALRGAGNSFKELAETLKIATWRAPQGTLTPAAE